MEEFIGKIGYKSRRHNDEDDTHWGKTDHYVAWEVFLKNKTKIFVKLHARR